MPCLPRLTSRQWATVVVVAFAEFASGVCVSLQAPFYPAEAERKGATASQYGFVFGCYELVIFLTSPLFGRYLPNLVPKFVLYWGLFLTGSCSILFGILDEIDDSETNTFVGLSFAVRVIEALGNSAFLTAAYSITAAEFPNSIATTFACLETFFGLGLIVGPAVGGFLFELGGYMLPFTVLGALLIGAALLTCLILPDSENLDSFLGGGLLQILRIPSILLASYSVFAASIALGYLSALLEPHLRQFALTPVEVGLYFVLEGGVYALAAPIWGFLCDRILPPIVATLLGAVLIVVGFILVGPAPFIPLETTLPLVTSGLVLIGFGVGALLVSAFTVALQSAILHGFPNNLSTFGLVSGLWTSVFALGAFVGPSVAGVLFDDFGFRYSTYFVIACNSLLATFVVLFLSCSKRPDRSAPLRQQGTSYGTITNDEEGGRVKNKRDENNNEKIMTDIKEDFTIPSLS